MPDTITEPGALWKRLLWFFGIAAASSLTVAAVAHGLRALLRI